MLDRKIGVMLTDNIVNVFDSDIDTMFGNNVRGVLGNKVFYIVGLIILVLASFVFSLNVAMAEENVREVISSAGKVAMAIDLYPDEFVVAVSPVRQTLQIVHSTARLAGALVSEVQNERFRKRLEEVVGELKVPGEFKQRYLDALRARIGEKVEEVLPMGSSAKYRNEHEARLARIQSLKKKGYDVLIDVKLTCGIYGPEGEMFFRLGGVITDLREEKIVWRGEVVVSSECKEMKITSPFKTYFNPFKSNYLSPRLTIANNALSRWTDNDGKNYFEFKKEGIDLAISAFFTGIGLEESAKGWLGLGISEMYKRKWKRALEYFDKCVSLEPDNIVAQNARVIALYKTEKIDEAVELGEKIVGKSSIPEVRYVFYNLSYIYARKKKELAKAEEYYQKYIQLGGKPEKKFNPVKK